MPLRAGIRLVFDELQDVLAIRFGPMGFEDVLLHRVDNGIDMLVACDEPAAARCALHIEPAALTIII
jgi:hypothetical protein